MLRWLLLLAIFATPVAGALAQFGQNAPRHQGKPYVILISFDGFRPEYLQRLNLPNFERVWRNGVRSTGMIPVFPSKTFPNHYSIVTGLYAENHGVVSNHFWDPQRAARYSMSDTTTVVDGSWYRGEPIWVTAEKQGMVAASYFWVASEAAIAGVTPTFTKTYDWRVQNFARVDSVLSWLALPAGRRPHMITMYFSDTDGAAHEHGPLSPQLDSAAARVDSALGRLLDGVDRLPIRDRVYFVLVSDHGMSETGPRWYAGLDTIIDMRGVRMPDAGTNANLHVEGGRPQAIVLRDSINRRMKHGRAYLREEVPAHLHYRRDPRAGDIVVIMEDHYQVGTTPRPPREGSSNHGWDPRASPMMAALFVARGPNIPAGREIGAFENIDVYPWLTELLGLKPARGIDGKRGRLARLIRDAR
ncbi:MAG TPA: ectonucleotide pyrophosphatase/phosphodiesterase [Gemmatimonadaceae bacterium]|nr:ectonucleotide pyrophosphatase/phosphodiesterase [Gemmatimonadaceae bacterium]